MAGYQMAPEKITKMAQEIIEQYHPELKDERIVYLLKDGAWTKNGKSVLGNAKKCSDKEMLLTGYSFIITLNSVVLFMGDNTIKAIIDHELSHCGVEEDGNGNKQRFIIGHDMEDFAHIIRRYGMYTDDVRYFMQAVKQISLFDDDRTIRVVNNR